MSGNQKQTATGGPQTQRFASTAFSSISQSRADGFPVNTPPGTYVPQQPNQGGNQAPGLRGITPTVPPNQASTPPNADLKVQSISQQPPSMNHMYAQQTVRSGQGPYYTTRSSAGPPTQTRMPSQHRPAQLYQTQQLFQMASVQQPMYIANPIQYYNTQRPANYVTPPIPVYPGPLPYSYTATTQQAAPVGYYNYQQIMPRGGPPPQATSAAPNPAQSSVQNMPVPPAGQQHAQFPRQTHKRRPKAIAVIDPDTGVDRLNEMYEQDMSHPPSGESSARQTPQPAPPNPNKEVQAAFAKQVAQAISADEVSIEDPEHHMPPVDHIDQSIYNPPQPQAVQSSSRFENLVQSSNLKAQAKEFVSTSITAKEPPVVSANCDAVEVTLPSKQSKDRESPVKGRKTKEQLPRDHKDAVKESNIKDVGNEKQSSIIKEETKQKETTPISVTNIPQSTDSKECVSQTRDDKRSQKKDNKIETKVPSVEASESIPVVVQSNLPTTDAKSKQNGPHRGKDNQKHQSASQNNQKSTMPSVPPPQPAKPNNKSHKKNELNMKGTSKEGTDMDMFNDNVVPDDKINANLNSNSNDTINANSLPITSSIQQSVNDLNKKSDNNDSTTKFDPKPRVDVCSIVKEKPKQIKPFTTVPVDSNEEPDKVVLNNDKIVQAKNEVNARVNSVNNDTPAAEIKTLPYKEDQWSPTNLQGKKVYDKNFLMLLRDSPVSRKKPDNLPEVVLLDDRGRLTDNRYSMSGRTDFTNPPFGSYSGKSSSQRGGVPPKRNSQSGKIGGGKNNKPIIKVSLSVKEDVKLHETENAWKPARFNKNEPMSDDEKKTEELYKRVRGVLNKLTPQKFDTLVSQVRSLQIDTAERLQGVIDLVFEKAVDEPSFSVAYAFMCKELALMQVPTSNSTEEKKEYVNFRKLLITRCQVEFEKQSKDESVRNDKLKEIEECTDPDKKKDLQFDLEEYDRRLRMKSVGNIRFIGELFKQNMLTTNIMIRCLNNLLTNKDEESLECLCKLLTTIGKELESKSINLGTIFGPMKDIVDKKHGNISSRVRFMLQDVIDLRNSKWVPRRQDQNPKTMDQIQKEADNEQLTIQAMNAVAITPRKDDRGNPGPNSDRKGRRNVSDDGWIQTSRNRTTPFTVQSEKLKIKAPQIDEPFGSSQLFGNWVKGSNMKTSQQLQSLPPSTNIYAALDSVDSDRRPLGSRHSNKDAYNSKGASLERSSYKQSYDGRGSRSGSQHRSHDSSSSSSQRSTPAPVVRPATSKPAQPSGPSEILSEEQLERRLRNNLDEFLNDSCGVDEYEIDLKNCVPTTYIQKLVYDACLHVLERSKTARLRTGYLFAHLIKRQSLPLSEYCSGIKEILSQADDLTIDIPKFWDYLSELLINMFTEEVLPLHILYESSKLLINQGHGSKFLASLFKLIINEKGPNFLQNLWRTCGLQLSNFMPSSQVDSFVNENNLQFLRGGISPVGQSELSYEQLKNKILGFLSSKTSLDDIVNWIKANVGDRIIENSFIRALATAIFENSISGNKLIVDNMKNNYNLLQKYVDNNPNLEIQCLYALQALFNKIEHPKGLLLSICSQLYEDSIFSQESFISWETSTDPAEQEGKGVALKQLTCFFTQLKENDDEEYGSSTSDEA